MALTLTQVPDGNDSWGRTGTTFFTAKAAASDYPTGGCPIATLNTSGGVSWSSGLGFRTITDIYARLTSTSGTPITSIVTLSFDPLTGKLQAFRSAGFTPTGTVAEPVVTVVGGQSAGAALQILPDSTAGVLGKTTATTVAIPGATFGIGAQAFTGGAVAAGNLIECAASTDLSGYLFRLLVYGNP